MTINTDDRVDLLRERVVVHSVRDDLFATRVAVTGPDEERARALVSELFDGRVDVAVCGVTPRGIHPRRCSGYTRRGARQLELRYELQAGEHVDGVLLAEDEDRVVVCTTVCAPLDPMPGEVTDYAYSVHLGRPLGDRIVFDVVGDEEVPRRRTSNGGRQRAGAGERAA